MATPRFSSRDFAANLEPVLADAVDRQSTMALAAARDYAALFTEPDLALYRPENIFQSFVVHFPPSQFDIHVEHVREELVGDTARMSACVGALVKGLERGPATRLVVDVFEREENSMVIPRMGIGFSGPGSVPGRFCYGGLFPMTLEELGDCWTLATSGGRIDLLENGVELRLYGMRMPPEALELAAEVCTCLGRSPSIEDAEAALALLEDRSAPAMLDLERLYAECLAAREDALSQGGIAHSYSFSEGFPQLPLNRNRMAAFMANLFDWALAAMPGGGTVEVLLEYDRARREATGIASLSAAADTVTRGPQVALMKRAIDFHHGELEVDLDGPEGSVTFTLGDTVGQTLDRWLPGWESFGPESRKYLRLLKSGAQAPPEDFILGGILEQELENWLLPRLVLPMTLNLVLDGTFRNDGIKGSIKERLQKALDQVGRGKPKKEICQPQYAGELFAAFRKDMHHRSALGTHVLTDDELTALCEGLLAKPVDALACLKLLAALFGRNA